ncbi:MAG: hypothetical protein ACTSWA_05200 [Candidatus Thorarchaeota archaeon]
MPEGLAVLKWDDELGPVVAAKTPRKLKIGLDPTTSMRVYGIATLGETEESQKPGFNTLTFPDFQLAVYYGGLNMHLKGLPSMVFLVLNAEEDPELYKDALPEIATQIFLNADDNKFKKMVPKLYKQIERYTQMTAEQRQASIINDPVRRIIIQTLMKQGTIQSAELGDLIFEQVGKQIDVDIVLGPLVKMGIIATGWVEGLSSEVIYLTRAMFVLRTTALDTIRAVREEQLPTKVGEEFLESTREFHKDYIERIRSDLFETVWTEAERLAAFILDFEAYDIIQVLRTGPTDIARLKAETNLNEEKIVLRLKRLEKADIIMRIKGKKGRKHILLKCNPEVVTIYPEWLIQRTVDLYNDEEIVSQQAIHYLAVLKRSHPSQLELTELETE